MDKTIYEYNKSWYDKAWKKYNIPKPHIWPHWRIIEPFLQNATLEIGPGSRPKIPIKDNFFIEISRQAGRKLREHGGRVYQHDLKHKFPFPSKKLNLVCAFEVLEHIPNDTFVFKEIHRTLKDDGAFIISFPINMKFWNRYDTTVGHVRRYEPKEIDAIFTNAGFKIQRYSGINIPWPNKITGFFLSFIAKQLPFLGFRLGEFFDSFPNAPVRKPIYLTTWNKNSYKDLYNFTTGFFVLKKAN